VIPRRPGQYTRHRSVRLAAPLVALLGVGAVLAFLGFAWWPFSVVALLVLVVQTQLAKRRDPFPWRDGARGEEAVGRALKTLESEGYRALHDVQTSHGNLDHVVIGPNGAFAIETKHWTGRFYPKRGQLMHNGANRMDVVKQATHEAMEVGRRLRNASLTIYVPALVVSTKAEVRGKPLSFRTATVIELADLPATIRRQRGGSLSETEIARAIAAVLRGDEPVTVRPVSQDSWTR
jgi:Nuclease-related domain